MAVAPASRQKPGSSESPSARVERRKSTSPNSVPAAAVVMRSLIAGGFDSPAVSQSQEPTVVRAAEVWNPTPRLRAAVK